MSKEINTAGLDAIKMNVSKGLPCKDAGYNNFIDIAAHFAVKALADKFKHNIVSVKEVKQEFSELKELYDTFAQAYVSERKVLSNAVANSYKAHTEIVYLNTAATKDEAFKYALAALRHITDDDYICPKWG